MTYAKIDLLGQAGTQSAFSAEYWNDPEKEKGKIWGQWDADFDGLMAKFDRKGLYQQLTAVMHETKTPLENAQVLSLGAGICLLESKFLKSFPQIKRLIALELSQHRIFEIAPKILEKFSIDHNRAELRFGSFLSTGMPDASVDVVVLSQAFHHTDQPLDLLKEIRRVLKPSGHVAIVGEHYFSNWEVMNRALKHFPKWVLNHRGYRKQSGIIPSWRAIFPIDLEKGDHHYNLASYQQMFEAAGFKFKRFIFTDYRNQGFLLSHG